MIISHKHKFIFFAPPKTGTHSIRFALRPQLGPDDEEHVNLFKSSKLSIPELSDRTDGHISVKDIRPYISDDAWNGYFKFCFVRNPWDRFVSAALFRNRNKTEETPGEILERIVARELITPTSFYRSQASYVLDSEQKPALDFVGRVENMQADFDHICRHVGLITTLLEKRNENPHEHYKAYYNKELIDKVATLYADDIALFGYCY